MTYFRKTYKMAECQFLIKALILCSVFFGCSSAPSNLTNLNSNVLPSSIIPEHYVVSLSPRLSSMTFRGRVVITGVAETSVSSIVLNCDSLNISSTEVYDDSKKEIGVDGVLCSDQECKLMLQESLQPDEKYTVELEFSGTIRTKHGIYADHYLDSDGTKHWMIMTEFQPVHARKAFPCFDQPAFKAQFEMHIARPQNMTVLSNMPLNYTTDPDPDEDFYVWDVFEETPPMSSYILAFVISDFVNVTDYKTNSSVWVPAEKINASLYTLQVGVSALLACQEYFGIEYTFPKLDHVPVPSQVFSAMENWGIVTYVQHLFYWQEGVSSSKEKLWNTEVIVHEVSHQWFGNLVTLKWWSFTWLNEGFAAFFNSLILDQIEPTWRMMDIFAAVNVQQMLAQDFDETSHPLVNNIITPSEIASNFDSTTYDKGAAILHMVYHFLTPEVFQKGLNLYLTNNAYSNVDDEDLWVSLESNANPGLINNLQDIMYNWTHEVGYPLINVERAANRSVYLTQVKYEKTFSNNPVLWWIPLTYTTSKELNFNNTEIKEWFEPQKEEHVLKIELEEQDWIILNIRQNGYYRVNYDAWTWQLLIHHLKTNDISEIHPVNRAMLLDDVFNLAESGDLSYNIALNLSTYLSKETDYIPWLSVINIFNNLRSKLYGSEEYHLLQKYMLDLVDNVYSNLSLISEGGDMITKLNRMQIIDFACSIGNKHCETESLKLVYQLMSGMYIELPVDLKATILCTAVRVGLEEAWKFVEKLYIKTNDLSQRNPLITALACSTQSEIILRLMKDTMLNNTNIRAEDAFSILHSISQQRHNSQLLLNFISENINPLIEKFHSEISILLSSITEIRMDEEDQTKAFEIQKILQPHSPDIKRIKENSRWTERYYDTVVDWLSRAAKTSTTVDPYSDIDNEIRLETTSSTVNFRTIPPVRGTTERNFGNRKITANIFLLFALMIHFIFM